MILINSFILPMILLIKITSNFTSRRLLKTILQILIQQNHLALKRILAFLLLSLEGTINTIFKLDLMKMKKMLIICKCLTNIKTKGKKFSSRKVEIFLLKTKYSIIIIHRIQHRFKKVKPICKNFKAIKKC